MDAPLAALPLENGAAVATTDRGFTGSPGVEILNPMKAAGGDRRR